MADSGNDTPEVIRDEKPPGFGILAASGDIDLVTVNGDVVSLWKFRPDGYTARLETLTGDPVPWPDVLPGDPA